MTTIIDVVEPTGMPEADQIVCPKCASTFEPKRRNQVHCSRKCQKITSNNASRGDRSGEHRCRNRLHYERAARLAEMIYSVPPGERLGVMRYILSFIETDGGLRNILTDLTLLREPRNADAGMNIAQAANAYTRKFFGVSIQSYLRQAREGTLNENHPVACEAGQSAVPRMQKLTDRNARCWHRPLSHEKQDKAERMFAEDMNRVSVAVADAEAQVDALCRTRMQLAANF